MMLKTYFYLVLLLVVNTAFAQTPCDVSIEITDLTTALGIPTYQFDAVPVGNPSSTTYDWSWDQGGSATGNSVTATFNFTGAIIVCVEVNDFAYNCNNTVCDSLIIGGNTSSCDAEFITNLLPSNSVEFVGNMSFVQIPNLLFEWDLGDGTTSSNPTLTHSYANPGLYTVCCTVEITGDCTDTYCLDIVVYDTYVPPTDSCWATFDYETTITGDIVLTGDGGVPNPDDGFITDMTWTYNGISQSGNPITIANNGLLDSIEVCLNATALYWYGGICVAEYCEYVSSNNNYNNNCDAGFEFDQANTTFYPLTVVFTANQSPNFVQSYLWDFGDGGTSTDYVPNHIYSSSGTYTICLTIETFDNCTDTYCATVDVEDAPLTNCSTNFIYDFTSSDSLSFFGWIDSDTTNIVNSEYTWTVAGIPFIYDQSFSVFIDNNTIDYAICLTTTAFYQDGTECTSSHCEDIVLQSNPFNCPITFTAEADPIDSLTYTFEAASIDPSTLQTIEWDFGDGTTSAEISPTHTYAAADSTIVCVTSVNVDAYTGIVCTANYCLPLFVEDNTPTPPSLDDCTGYFIYNGNTATGAVGFTPILSLFNFDNEYFWDFGDGTTDTVSTPVHLFPQDGMYNVCLTISNDSCSETYCEWIEVEVFSSGFGITGTVNLTGEDFAIVYLIEFNETDSTLTAIDVALADYFNNGFYSFSNIDNGEYLVKAALIPGSELYWDYLPTYYGDVELWQDADYVTINNNFADGIDINLIAGQNLGGPGFIGGLISEGSGKVELDGIAELEVILYNELQQPVQYTYTDDEGNYQFDNLPYGTYWITADHQGIEFPMVEVVIDGINSEQINTDFASGIDEIISGIYNSNLIESGISIYPNPTKGIINLSFEDDTNQTKTIEIYDLVGKLVLTQSLNNKLSEIQCNLKGGLYLLKIVSDNKVLHSETLLILE